MLYPLLLDPIYQDYLWGGREIVTKYERSAPAQKRYAESWEICDRDEYNSKVHNGPLRGTTLRELLREYPYEMYGILQPPKKFPLLIKLIDAYQQLSVQVHPDENAAKKDHTEPKTECWYILDAKEGSQIYAGLQKPLTKEGFLSLAGTDALADAMQVFTPKRGDVFFIPGGRLHAIGAGILLLEIQQNSDTTYRVYDWGRLQDDGTARPLHVEKAAECVHLDDIESPRISIEHLHEQDECALSSLVDTPYFSVKQVSARKDLRLNKTDPGCEILFFEEGEGTLIFENHTLSVTPGMTVLIPHHCKKVTLETSKVSFIVIRPKL